MRRVGLSLTGNLPLGAALEQVLAAEAAGFEMFWMHETYFQRDAVSFLGAMAPRVRHIRLAPGCVGPYTRHPVLLAMTLATLAEASAAPVALGLGSGNPDRLVEIGFERRGLTAAGVGEAIEICRRLWAGERVSYEGAHFSIPGVALQLPRPRLPIPIYVAGWSSRMLRLCGRQANGYLARPGEPVGRLRALVRSVRAAAADAGRQGSEIDVAANLLCSVADDEASARAAARHDPFVLYLFSSSASVELDPQWKARLGERLRRGETAAAAALVSDRQLADFTLCGTPGQVCAAIDAFTAAGVDQPVLQPLRPEPASIGACLAAGRLYAARGAA